MRRVLHRYVEDLAQHYEAQGLPRIAGRILAHLLVCDPPEQSAGELAEALGCSKASVSTMTRLLLAGGAIEQARAPGARTRSFRISTAGLEAKFVRRIQEAARTRALAEDGLALLADAPPSQRARLEHIRSLYGFLEGELPALLERWRASRLQGAPEGDDDA